MRKEKKKRTWNAVMLGVMSCVLIALLATGISFGVLKHKLKETNFDSTESTTTYSKHYAFIAENSKDSYWNLVWKAAEKEGKTQDICVEQIGSEMAEDFSVKERMQIAIAADVDGILLHSTKEDIQEELDAAKQAHIPVVTMLGESGNAGGDCFVGVNSYALGKNYGRQVHKLLTGGKKRICVLLDSAQKTTEEKTIINGMQEVLKDSNVEIGTRILNTTEQFAAEEEIRGILLEKKAPDILVCLSASDTMYAYQSAVDYNRVGKTLIVGSYVNDEIQSAIDKGIVSSVITVYSEELGLKAVTALTEMQKQGTVNEYQTVTSHIIEGGVQ